jgi:hypothetical protein
MSRWLQPKLLSRSPISLSNQSQSQESLCASILSSHHPCSEGLVCVSQTPSFKFVAQFNCWTQLPVQNNIHLLQRDRKNLFSCKEPQCFLMALVTFVGTID